MTLRAAASPSSTAQQASVAFVSVITADYLPWARALAWSIVEHHPGARLQLLVLDGLAPQALRADDPIEIVGPAELRSLPFEEYGRMMAIYDGFELSCAMKAFMALHALEQSDVVIYLDTDMQVYAPLDEIVDAALRRGMAVTPHMLDPDPDPELRSEIAALRTGQFNAGLFAASRDGRPALTWWGDRQRRECFVDLESGIRFVDQRWLDMLVGYFPIEIVRHRGANVAIWNLLARTLERGPDGHVRVDGERLLCFHFSAFSIEPSDYISRHDEQSSRFPLSANPELRELADRYRARLLAAQDETPAPASRSLSTLPTGVELGKRVKQALRTALTVGELHGVPDAPSPFTAEGAVELWDWLRQPVGPRGLDLWTTMLLLQFAPLRRALPRPTRATVAAWAEEHIADAVPPPLRSQWRRQLLGPVSGRIALIEVDELAAEPALLDGLGQVPAGDDPWTLVFWSSRLGTEDAHRIVSGLLEHCGERADEVDMVLLHRPVAAAEVEGVGDLVVTRRDPRPALSELPRARDLAGLRGEAQIGEAARAA